MPARLSLVFQVTLGSVYDSVFGAIYDTVLGSIHCCGLGGEGGHIGQAGAALAEAHARAGAAFDIVQIAAALGQCLLNISQGDFLTAADHGLRRTEGQ